MRKNRFRLTALIITLVLLLAGVVAAAESAANQTVQLPLNLKVVANESFAGSGMKALVVTSGVTTIETRAFADCKNLEDVVLPNHDIDIADDAFAGCGDVLFHAFAGTKNELWALSHGFRCESMDADMLSQASAMLTKFGIPSGALAGTEDYTTCCLIVKMNGSRLPDISEFNPTDIIQAGRNRFFIQFDTTADTENCHNYLEASQETFGIDYVEVDRYRDVVVDEAATQKAIISGWSTDDPMGFAEYSQFVAEESTGSAVIAVLDSGFPSNAAYNDKLLSSKAKSFTRDGNSWNYDGCNHGKLVAAVLADCIGDADIKLLPIRVSDGRGRVDTISLLLALEYAAQQGADFINMSLCFDDAGLRSSSLEDAISNLDCKVIVAAGNHGGSRMSHFPANHPDVIAVSAVDEGPVLASYSAYDAHYAAPGLVSSIGLTKSGTSFAAPQVTAALALLELDPNHDESDLFAVCDNVAQTSYGMPVMSKLARCSVSSIQIENAPATMVYGDFFTLDCTVVPAAATNRTYTCETSNSSVLKVSTNSTGVTLIEAVGKGSATLTVTSNDDPTIRDTAEIHVVKPVEAVTILDGSSGTMYMNRTLALTASVEPADASNTAVNWKSSNTAVATIDQSGNIKPVAPGKTTITAEAKDGYGAYATYLLTVEERPLASSVVVTYGGSAEKALIGVGSQLQLNATVQPADAVQGVVWKSLFPEYATVDANGVVTAIAPGTAVINARSMDGNAEDAWQLEVKEVAGSVSVTGAKTAINQGETLQLIATVLPEDALDKTVTWTSLNPAVATVSSTGLVTGVSDGEANIKVTSAADSSVFAYFTVRVHGIFTVTFNSNRPSGADNPVLTTTTMQAQVNTPLGQLPTPTLNHYNFGGWYLNVDCTGVRVTESYSFTLNLPVTLFAKWTPKAESGWVLESAVPAGAKITATSWSYREATETTSSTLSGWTGSGSYWQQTGTGSTNYAKFPSGYNTSNTYYTSFAKSAYEAYDNGTRKREVTNTKAGYIYWHWMYNVKYATGTGRTISSKKGSFNADGSSGGPSFKYFYAMASSVDCPYLDNYYCCSRNERSYNCKKLVDTYATSTDKTSTTSGLGTDRFFRFEYYTSTYKDYQKVYTYYRDLSYQSVDPGNGGNISNKIKYVKYIAQ